MGGWVGGWVTWTVMIVMPEERRSCLIFLVVVRPLGRGACLDSSVCIGEVGGWVDGRVIGAWGRWVGGWVGGWVGDVGR